MLFPVRSHIERGSKTASPTQLRGGPSRCVRDVSSHAFQKQRSARRRSHLLDACSDSTNLLPCPHPQILLLSSPSHLLPFMTSAFEHGHSGTKIGALLFSFLVCSLFIFNIPAAQLPTKLGDLDVDGQITVLDLVRLINHLNGSSALTSEILPFADLNGDALINQSD